jgi:hypothetical protein
MYGAVKFIIVARSGLMGSRVISHSPLAAAAMREPTLG